MSSKKNLIRWLITIVVFLVFGVYFLLNLEDFKPLLNVNFALLFLIAFGNLAVIFAYGLFTKFTLVPFDKFISVRESFYVSILSSVGNFFTSVGGGLGFRAIYLKKKHGLAYAKYLSTVSGNYILVFLITSLIGLGSLYSLRTHQNAQYFTLILVFGVIFLATISLIYFRLPKFTKMIPPQKPSSKLSILVEVLDQVSTGWDKITGNKKLLTQLLFITLFNIGVTVLNTYLIIESLGFSVGLAELLLFSVLGALSLFINITPANLGVKEAVYIFSATVIGFSVSEILAIALIERGVLFIALLGLWAYSSKIKQEFNEIS